MPNAAGLSPTQALMVAVAWVDGRLEERESLFLRQVLANGTVSVETIEACLAGPTVSLEEALADLPHQGEEILGEVLRLCFADDVLEFEEMELIDRLAQHLRVSPERLEALRQRSL